MVFSHQKLPSHFPNFTIIQNTDFASTLFYKCQSSVISAYSYFLKVTFFVLLVLFLHLEFSDMNDSKCYGYSYALV